MFTLIPRPIVIVWLLKPNNIIYQFYLFQDIEAATTRYMKCTMYFGHIGLCIHSLFSCFHIFNFHFPSFTWNKTRNKRTRLFIFIKGRQITGIGLYIIIMEEFIFWNMKGIQTKLQSQETFLNKIWKMYYFSKWDFSFWKRKKKKKEKNQKKKENKTKYKTKNGWSSTLIVCMNHV